MKIRTSWRNIHQLNSAKCTMPNVKCTMCISIAFQSHNWPIDNIPCRCGWISVIRTQDEEYAEPFVRYLSCLVLTCLWGGRSLLCTKCSPGADLSIGRTVRRKDISIVLILLEGWLHEKISALWCVLSVGRTIIWKDCCSSWCWPFCEEDC